MHIKCSLNGGHRSRGKSFSSPWPCRSWRSPLSPFIPTPSESEIIWNGLFAPFLSRVPRPSPHSPDVFRKPHFIISVSHRAVTRIPPWIPNVFLTEWRLKHGIWHSTALRRQQRVLLSHTSITNLDYYLHSIYWIGWVEDAVDIDRRFHNAAAMIVMTMNDGVAFAAADPFFISPIRIKDKRKKERRSTYCVTLAGGG